MILEGSLFVESCFIFLSPKLTSEYLEGCANSVHLKRFCDNSQAFHCIFWICICGFLFLSLTQNSVLKKDGGKCSVDVFRSWTEILNSVSVKPVERSRSYKHEVHVSVASQISVRAANSSVKCFGFFSSNSTARFHILHRTETLIILLICADSKAVCLFGLRAVRRQIKQ